MTWMLMIYATGINGIMFLGEADPNRFATKYECQAYAMVVRWHIEKTESAIRRTTFKCVEDQGV